jgi:hypothetical protein
MEDKERTKKNNNNQKIQVDNHREQTPERLHFMNFDLAGFTYWDGVIVFNDLHVGTQLRLVREKHNEFDPYAIALYYGNYKIGYIPKERNKEISILFDMGWETMFDARINRISDETHPEHQIGVVVYVKNHNK